jgi:hypothetical protein
VSVTGQFGGRNLFGDVPVAPAKDKYDFVLRNTEGAVWVTGLRPKGKGFDLNVDARVDTSHWLQVSGLVKRDRGLVLLEAKTIAPAQPPATRVVIAEPPPAPKEPGEIVFSSPVDGEERTVSGSAPIRVQFSRGIDPPTLNGHFRLTYIGGAAPEGSNRRAGDLRRGKSCGRIASLKTARDVSNGQTGVAGGREDVRRRAGEAVERHLLCRGQLGDELKRRHLLCIA